MQPNYTTEERELEILNCLKKGDSVNQIIKDKKTSGRLVIKIKKKYGLWGV